MLLFYNNGLHGFHLNDETEYAEGFEKSVAFLRETYSDIPLYLSSSTQVADEDRENPAKNTNNSIRTVAEKHNLPVIDLYTVSMKNADLLSNDGVHFNNYMPLCIEAMRNIKHLL